MVGTQSAVRVEDVSRRFGHRWVLRNVSMEVAPGEAVMLVGGNGAGKTTLLRVMAGLLRPKRGSVVHEGTLGMVAHHAEVDIAHQHAFNRRIWRRLGQ